MIPKILILGSTGKLGKKLLRFCNTSNINIFGIACYKNYNLLNSQSRRYSIRNFFKLSDKDEVKRFISFLKKNS